MLDELKPVQAPDVRAIAKPSGYLLKPTPNGTLVKYLAEVTINPLFASSDAMMIIFLLFVLF